MSIRKTESRIPAGLSATDLGEAANAADNKSVLVSYVTSPLVKDRENCYVLFVTDPALGSAVENYEWSVSENGGAAVISTTAIPEFKYKPSAIGDTIVSVKLLGAGNADLGSITMSQVIVELNFELEDLITAAKDETGPGIGNIDVARELVNDHNPYYQSIIPAGAEPPEPFKHFIFGMTSDGVLVRKPEDRNRQLQELAASLNQGDGDFASLAAQGGGVCNIRLSMLAMVIPGALSWTEIPETPPEKANADHVLRQLLAALDDNKKIDLYNIVRFPKSNISYCAKITEAIRDKYFAGVNFEEVMTGMSGTRAHWILKHYSEGPIIRS